MTYYISRLFTALTVPLSGTADQRGPLPNLWPLSIGALDGYAVATKAALYFEQTTAKPYYPSRAQCMATTHRDRVHALYMWRTLDLSAGARLPANETNREPSLCLRHNAGQQLV